MFRASRALFAKSTVRPVLHTNKNVSESSVMQQRRPRITPIGIAFILGGLALGSYMLKPTTRMPTAAMDTFKPQVAIIFAKGDSKGAVREAASNMKFQYINYKDGLDKMGPLTEQGYTRFLIDGFSSTDEINAVEESVVSPDLVLDFDQKPVQGLRIVPMSKSDSIENVIKDRNLV